MKSLWINPAWDGAGCSYRQAMAINKYTEHTARHYRAEKTFYDQLDLGMENYDRDEFVSLIEEADILHFCSATHTYGSKQDWGFDWGKYIKGKPTIFHCYNAFLGHWRDRANARDQWDRLKDIGYNAIFSSIPQSIYVYDKCIYVPDLVDEQDYWFKPGNGRDLTKVNLCHFPTGSDNNKNTNEFNAATKQVGIDAVITNGLTNKEVLNIKKKSNLGFDAIWRGFHGATSIENLAMGIPTMCGIDEEFATLFKIYFECDQIPFEDVKTVEDIVEVINKYSNDNDALRERCNFVRNFMVSTWSAKNIANNIIKEYEKL